MTNKNKDDKKVEINYPEEISQKETDEIESSIQEFCQETCPLEASLYVQVDKKTKAKFCVCHLKAKILVKFSTIDVPLDPEEQAEYRANRDIFEDHPAYEKMQADAKEGRVFNDIVAEYTKEFNATHPIKIIGGQHRFNAIQLALANNVDNYHGMRIYFNLDTEQRLDVQLISNTNIAVSPDLIDRMYETASGPQLRDWCHKVGLLEKGKDFSSKRQRGQAVTVRDARTFIMNFYQGQGIDELDFSCVNTIPVLAKNGLEDEDWNRLKNDKSNLWEDKSLIEAAKEFVKLIDSQRTYYKDKKTKQDQEYSEKAYNHAILSAWSYVTGVLQQNKIRIKRHYNLSLNKNPLRAEILAKGRHKSDPQNYRGLGTRNDAKERGRCAGVGVSGRCVSGLDFDAPTVSEYHPVFGRSGGGFVGD
ncbi:MAG: hypothetical protein L0Y36_01130 [Planctomycetales bacterium]|nr:hypothetical protein [Planctomycetales bacterium]